MNKCWASSLNNCSEVISKEHTVCQGIFESNLLKIKGFKWCKSGKEIGIGSVSSKILCEYHNNLLSTYDSEASKLSRFIRKVLRKEFTSPSTIDLDGLKLEKWALKTLLNFGILGGLTQPKYNKIEAPEELVQYVYSDKNKKDGFGLYSVVAKLEGKSNADHFSWNASSPTNEPTSINGMLFRIHGVPFLINVLPSRIDDITNNISDIEGIDYSSGQLIYKPTSISITDGNSNMHTINFIWP